MRQLAPGTVQELAPGLRGILAPNPGPMTHWGTNTFVVGTQEIAVIDPGPDSPDHLDAILNASRGGMITHILVTHAHLDHSPLAQRLASQTGAPVLAYGRAEAGRNPVMTQLVADGLVGGGEGVDAHFMPDQQIGEGDQVQAADWTLDVLHTPGHFAGHLSFRFGDLLLSGDHVMDWSSSLVSPPDGDLARFMATSRRLRMLKGLTFYPAHGGPIHDPVGRLDWLIAHREAREAAILETLRPQPKDIPTLTRAIYTDIPTAMLPAAERNVFAHLIDLVERNIAVATPKLSLTAGYQRA